jgi:hypothetical protein
MRERPDPSKDTRRHSRQDKRPPGAKKCPTPRRKDLRAEAQDCKLRVSKAPERTLFAHQGGFMPTTLDTEISGRVRECDLNSRAFGIWTSTLRPANLFFVVGAGLLSLIAGASILKTNDIISPMQAGIIALISSGLTLTHHLLGCDPHQAECRRLKGAFDGLRIAYSGLHVLTNEAEIRKRIAALDAELATVVKGAAAAPARWCISRAQRELGELSSNRVKP